jgi:hypothetical protein
MLLPYVSTGTLCTGVYWNIVGLWREFDNKEKNEQFEKLWSRKAHNEVSVLCQGTGKAAQLWNKEKQLFGEKQHKHSKYYGL